MSLSTKVDLKQALLILSSLSLRADRYLNKQWILVVFHF